MKQIPLDAKVLSITHLDWDGAVCQIILCNVYKNIDCVTTSFYNVDKLLLNLDYSKYDYVFLTDLHPEKEATLGISDKIIMIDHHKTALPMNNPSRHHYVITGVCGSVLVKRFCEKMYNIKLKHLDNLVYLTNDYDMYTIKNPKSKLLNDVMFYLYGPDKFRDLFIDGRTRFTKDEIEWLKKCRIEFKETYENLNVYDFLKYPACVVETENFINEIAHKLMQEKEYRMVVVKNPNSGRVSIRHNIDGFDMGNYLKSKGWGGGHELAAGMFVDDSDDFVERMMIMEEDLADEIQSLIQ